MGFSDIFMKNNIKVNLKHCNKNMMSYRRYLRLK